MIIAILGVLKSGAAYLPLAPNFPKDRVAFMLKDTKAKALLTDNSTFKTAKKQNIPTENLEEINYERQVTNHQSPRRRTVALCGAETRRHTQPQHTTRPFVV